VSHCDVVGGTFLQGSADLQGPLGKDQTQRNSRLSIASAKWPSAPEADPYVDP
jgi:hypothetical protein